jgi:hypothetical protein
MFRISTWPSLLLDLSFSVSYLKASSAKLLYVISKLDVSYTQLDPFPGNCMSVVGDLCCYNASGQLVEI